MPDSEALLRSPYSPFLRDASRTGILRQALPLAERGEAQRRADRTVGEKK